MPKTDLEEIERLRRDVSLERLVEARGVELRPDEDKLVGRCPFHENAEHALILATKANTWTCSGCDVTDGTTIEWTMKAEGISRRHAVELLRADHAGGGTEKLVKHSTTQKLPELIAAGLEDAKLLEQVVTYYADTLKRTPPALDMLKQYGVGAEAIERFRIGVSDRSLGYRLPRANRKAGAEVRGRLQRLGILRQTGHESLRGCITVPLLDEDDAVVTVYGRRLDDRAVETADVYASSISIGVFNIEALRTNRDIVVCSSVFDALVMWSNGVRGVTAVHDANRAHLKAHIAKSAIAKVTLCFPRTVEGDGGAEQLKEVLSAAEVEIFRALLPSGMDARSFIASSSSLPSEALATVLRQAEWIGGLKPKSPSPAVPVIDPPAATEVTQPTNTADIVIELGDRRWRVRGLANNHSYERLRVHLFVSRETKDSRTSGFFVDTIELYSARQRNAFVEQAGNELGLDGDVVKKDLGHVLLRLEALQDEQIRATLQPKTATPTMTDSERTAAMDLLRDPKLVERIVADFDRCGVVGESENALVGYLAATSRKLRHPLAIVFQSSSGSGKSSLMQAVLDFVPEEERRSFSALTGQSIFYMGEGDIAFKVLSIAEEEAKEAGTGRLVTHEYRVQGPVAIFTTTTAIDVDEELLSRCIVLAVDERPEQTHAIQERQRQAQTLEGLFGRVDRETTIALHRNAQRLLTPIAIVNPFASELSFSDHRVRARRDHRKYLGLIEAITLLRQHQRTAKTAERNGVVVEYIEVTKDDLALADRLIASVVSRGLDDLPPMTKRLLTLLDVMVREAARKQGVDPADVRFTRREVRERLGLGSTQAWVHLRRLIEGEYLLVHPSRRGRGVVFELALEPAPTATSSGAEGASSEVPSVDVRPAEESTTPEKTAADPLRSVSARSHTGAP